MPEKLSSKVAKELYDIYADYEAKYKRYFSGKAYQMSVIFLCTVLVKEYVTLCVLVTYLH